MTMFSDTLLRVNEVDITNIIKHKTKDDDIFSALLYKGSNTFLIYFKYKRDITNNEYLHIINKYSVNDYKFKAYLDYYNKSHYKQKWFNFYNFRYDLGY